MAEARGFRSIGFGDNCMRFAIPNKAYLSDDFHRKMIETRIVCSQTMKEKWDDNEQYCKHYHPAEDWKKKMNNREHVIEEIERKLGENNE